MSAPNSVILAFLPTADCVAIKVYHNKPDLMTKEEEDAWTEQSRLDAWHLKGQLEFEEIGVDSPLMNRLIFNALPNPFTKDVSRKIIRELIGMDFSEHLKRDLIKITANIRESITVTRANTERCLQLLEDYKRLRLNKLLLVSYPICVATIRNLQNYVGNLNAWNLTAAEEVTFKTEAKKIRREAKIIYNSFKIYFQPMNKRNFWEYYVRMAMVYKAYKIEQRQFTANN